MTFLRRWWPHLALVAVVAVIVAGTVLSLGGEPKPNVDQPLRLEPTAMNDNLRNRP